ncbi:hypothetical protein [Pleurocapsa sp. PCC 7319]|nr:hypothetical protein [Pleurocapsa sp. PCC 7319]
MSPEVIPGVIDFIFQADQAFQKFAAAEMNLIQSTDFSLDLPESS